MTDILYATKWTPDPLGGGTQQRAAAHLRALARCGRVHLLYLGDGACNLPASMAPCAQSVTDGARIARHWHDAHPQGRMAVFWRRLTAQAWGMSGLIEQPDHALMNQVHAALPLRRFDALFAFHLGSALLVDQLDLLAPRAPRIVDWDFLESQSVLPLARITHRPLGWWKNLSARRHAATLRLWESRILQRWDLHLCSSPVDLSVLQRRIGASAVVQALGNSAPVPGSCPPPCPPGTPPTAIFVGTFGYWPNEDAALHLLDDIWPAVRAKHPDARLLLVGRAMPDGLRSRHGTQGIELHADVPDVLPFYKQAHLALLPLRFAVGSNLKVPEAMAQARLVLAYRGPASRHAASCAGIWPVDDADQFAQALIQSFDDPAVTARRGQQAWAEAREGCSSDILDARLAAMVREVMPPAGNAAAAVFSPGAELASATQFNPSGHH